MSLRHLPRILAALLAASLLAAGCSNVTGPAAPAPPSSLATIVLPEDATLEAAVLRIYSADPADTTVHVHRVTAPWDETAVTWNSFGGAYDPAVVATFRTPLPPGYVEVDITDLVLDWADGVHENHGLLLRQDALTDRNTFWSREHDTDRPQLVLHYMTAAGPDSVVAEPLADVVILELIPDSNFGSEPRLHTGWRDAAELEKQALLRFDVVELPGGGNGGDVDVHSLRWWRRHDGHGQRPNAVTPLLPLWLGHPGGDKSLAVTDASTARAVLRKRHDRPRNAVTRLGAQLLAAKLNIANGADGAAAAQAIAAADAFLTGHDASDWRRLTRAQKRAVSAWKRTLRAYNRGELDSGS